MKKFGNPAQDALDQTKNDDAGIPAPSGRRLYEQVVHDYLLKVFNSIVKFPMTI